MAYSFFPCSISMDCITFLCYLRHFSSLFLKPSDLMESAGFVSGPSAANNLGGICGFVFLKGYAGLALMHKLEFILCY